jgi:hypothetical protein
MIFFLLSFCLIIFLLNQNIVRTLIQQYFGESQITCANVQHNKQVRSNMDLMRDIE